MAEASDRHGKMIDAALRIYRPAMRRYITDTLKGALGDAWYEEWLEPQLEPSSQLPKKLRRRYDHNLHRARNQKVDPCWLIEEGDFPDIIEARGAKFPPGLRDLAALMRQIAEDSVLQPDADELRARQQADRILENSSTVLQEIDPDAAEQIRQLSEAGEPDKPWEADVGSFRRSTDNNHVIYDIFVSYRDWMRVYIRTTLQREYRARTQRDDWFSELVINMWGNPDKGRMEEAFSDGKSADEIIDVLNFPYIIRYNQGYFPPELREGAYDYLFRYIHGARNKFDGHHSQKPQMEDFEDVARACATILELCRDDRTTRAAGEIRRHLRGDEDRQLVERPDSAGGVVQSGSASGGSGPSATTPERMSDDGLEPDLLRSGDREQQDQEVRRREMNALSDRAPEARGDLESAERERERRPFFGGAFARLWASEAAQSGSAGGDDAFVAGGEVDEREPVRDHRRQLVAGVILAAVILVGLAVLAILALSAESGQEGTLDLPEPAVPTPTAELAEQEPPADDDPPAPEPNPEKDDPSTPLPGTESNSQGGAEPSSPGSEQTPPDSTDEDGPSESDDGGQAEAGGGEQTEAGGCTGDECSTEPESQQERPADTSSDAGGGRTSDSGDSSQKAAGGGEETERVDCVTDEEDNCVTEAGGGEETEGTECNGVTDDDGNCSTDGEGETLSSDDDSQTEAGGGQDGDEMETSDEDALEESDEDDGLEGDNDAMGWDNSDELGEEDPVNEGPMSDYGFEVGEEERGTTHIIIPTQEAANEGSSQAEVVIVIAEDNPTAFINDGGSQPDAPEEEGPGTTIIVIPTEEPADGDVMEDDE